ncbi:heme biosynthesis protein HemY [Pseudogemmobacter faecipullorum]|uniref:Heme biosynthesis protein HemY n=1 Tax=Pseudogemmobacter faecipullorum TaxID=2755041 RepID=A0ABS8CJ81_9RHOB|nr:heme biosynthesis HemY N-terminal domain-containing protein [Pseudogemmobacter faecipullorum]MCB5409441.1 heme biosynthesis protein HemY [Pseudogemmobacter faecipullorum]
MLWSLAKIAVFLALIAALAVGSGLLAEQGGSVRIWVFDQEFTFSPLMALLGVIVLLVLVWLSFRVISFVLACLRFLNGDETAISRYFDRNRERRGYAALSEGMIALASGEPVLAMARARTAERLLNQPELTRLLTAQAAEAAGDNRAATEAWKSLLGDEQTRFVAVRGLLRQKLAKGDTATALKLAEQAFALKPKHGETQDLLLKLQAEGGDWAGARGTLSQKLRSGELPRSVYRRRDALLALQEAKTVLDEGSSIEAREAAIEANKLSPDLIPAAVIAARALVEKEDRKGATRVLKKAWEAQPHPELATAFAGVEPDETPAQRLKRFRILFQARPDHEESRLTEAELNLANEDFLAAKTVLGDLPQSHPTQRSLAILAAVERGMVAPDDEVRAVLARALSASRGAEWLCEKCGAIHAQWVPVCASCSGFDTLAWREPEGVQAHRPASGAGLEPLLFAATRPAPAVPEPAALPLAELAEADPPEPALDDPGILLPHATPDEILRRVT